MILMPKPNFEQKNKNDISLLYLPIKLSYINYRATECLSILWSF